MASSSLTKRPIGIIPRERWQEPSIRQLNTFAWELGRRDEAAGREIFQALVSMAAVSDERLDQLLAAFALPEAEGLTVGEVVVGVGLRPGEILKIVRDAALSVSQARSIAQLAEHLPAITLDVATRAQVHYLPCTSCYATGWVTPRATKEDPEPKPEKCLTCNGATQVRHEAEFDRQQLALEMGKLLPKAAGTNIAVVNNNAGSGVQATSSVFSSLVRATDRILHGDGLTRPVRTPAAEPEVLDAVVVASPPADPREELEDEGLTPS
jgi:hypothetical protein